VVVEEPGAGEVRLVTITFTADYTIEEVTAEVKKEIATIFAAYASASTGEDISLDKVFVDAEPASVLITVQIIVDTAAIADTLTNAVQTQLSTAAGLTAMLVAGGMTDITVESGASVSVEIGEPPEQQFSLSSDSAPVGAIVGGVVGGIVVIAIIAGVVVMKGKGGKGGNQSV
jgi:hypothetical protein